MSRRAQQLLQPPEVLAAPEVGVALQVRRARRGARLAAHHGVRAQLARQPIDQVGAVCRAVVVEGEAPALGVLSMSHGRGRWWLGGGVVGPLLRPPAPRRSEETERGALLYIPLFECLGTRI